MRLDIFLKLSRLIPRRTLAQEFCDKGLIEVNGAVAKSSKEVKADDEIVIKRGNRITTLTVRSVPDKKQLPKEAAVELYAITAEERIESI